jgi:hypothetical protein
MLKQIYGLRVAVPGSVIVDGKKPAHPSQVTKSRLPVSVCALSKSKNSGAVVVPKLTTLYISIAN